MVIHSQSVHIRIFERLFSYHSAAGSESGAIVWEHVLFILIVRDVITDDFAR